MLEQKIIITETKGRRLTALFENNKVVELHYSSDKTKPYRLGEIYVGKVKKILPNRAGAFVEIGNHMECYYPLEEKCTPVFTAKYGKNALVAGDELLVQIHTEALKTKQPSVTGNLSFTGKYAVITSGNHTAGASNKLEKTKKEELLAWWKEASLSFPGEFGIIFRTNAGEVPKEQILTDIQKLYDEYTQIIQYGKTRTCFSCIRKAEDSAISILRDLRQDSLKEIVVDAVCENGKLYQETEEFLKREQPEDLPLLRPYTDASYPLMKCYNLEQETSLALQERVWMKSGAYLVIQPTEALTVIDVNSGKCQKKKQAFLQVNYEAAAEAARQIRLRNLSGIILIDFINLSDMSEKEALMKHLQEELYLDRNPGKVVDMTKLQLVEITRKKIRKTLAGSLSD